MTTIHLWFINSRACIFAFILFVNYSHAGENPVPDSVKFADLPKGTKLLFREKMDTVYRNNDGDDLFDLHLGNKEDLLYIVYDDLNSGKKQPGDVVEIEYPIYMFTCLKLKHKCLYGIYENMTVGYFHRKAKGRVAIVSDSIPDPYAAFDNETKLKLLMKKVEKSVVDTNFVSALFALEYIERNVSGILPEDFYYRYIFTLVKLDKVLEGQMRAAEFLKKYGKKSKYYSEVVLILSN